MMLLKRLEPKAATRWVYSNVECGRVAAVGGSRPARLFASQRIRPQGPSVPVRNSRLRGGPACAGPEAACQWETREPAKSIPSARGSKGNRYLEWDVVVRSRFTGMPAHRSPFRVDERARIALAVRRIRGLEN